MEHIRREIQRSYLTVLLVCANLVFEQQLNAMDSSLGAKGRHGENVAISSEVELSLQVVADEPDPKRKYNLQKIQVTQKYNLSASLWNNGKREI